MGAARALEPTPPLHTSLAGVFREATTEFSVDARALTQTGGPHVKARVANPSGNLTETYVQDRGDGTYKVEYTPYEEGACVRACERGGPGAGEPGLFLTPPLPSRRAALRGRDLRRQPRAQQPLPGTRDGGL